MQELTAEMGAKYPVSKAGSLLTWDNAIRGHLPAVEPWNLMFYGKSVQDGTPVAIQSVGGDGVCCGRNLFEPSNVYVGWFNDTAFKRGDGDRTIYASCESGKTYNVSTRVNGGRHRLCTSAVRPVRNAPNSDYKYYADNAKNVMQITADVGADYVCAYIYDAGVSTNPINDVLNGAWITDATTTTVYTLPTLRGIPLGASIPSAIELSAALMAGVWHDGMRYWCGDTYEPDVIVSGAQRSRTAVRVGVIDSYNGESVGDYWISSTGALTAGATVYYLLSAPIVTLGDPVPIPSVKGVTNIYTTSAVQPHIRASVLTGR